jgi:cysteine synthase B
MNILTHSPEQLAALEATARLVGDTPLIPISHAFQKDGVELYAKAEWFQLGQSVKARAAFGIIQDAILQGQLDQNRRLLDASSGNTAIAYAAICARLQIPLTICLPKNASMERKLQLKSLGAELILTSPLEGTDGAQLVARKLAEAEPDLYFYADQYNNPNNWKAHYLHTAREVYQQTQGRITHFVSGLGTSGTFTGTGRKLKEVHREIQLIALHPETAMHGLEGWKDMETARVPGIYDPNLADDNLRVSTGEAYEWVQKMAREEGLLVSPSAAANLAGAAKVASRLETGVVVTIMPDDSSKYQEVYQQIFSLS